MEVINNERKMLATELGKVIDVYWMAMKVWQSDKWEAIWNEEVLYEKSRKAIMR